MLIRRELFERVGGLDEAYALHGEDLDLMYRLTEKGYPCLLVPAASAIHRQGLSSRQRPFWVHRQKHRGMQRFFTKFQASERSAPFRWLVYCGIWLHWLITLPRVWLQR